MNQSPRQLAHTLLMAWEKAPYTLDQCLERHQDQISAMQPKDKRLFNALVFGILRHRLTLDGIIESHSHLPLKKISLPVLYALRMAIYQLVFMDKIPAFAAIDTAVRLAKSNAGKKAAGFANAVLRKVASQPVNPEELKDNAGQDNNLGIQYSFPFWLMEKWTGLYGIEKTRQLCQGINTIPPITLRVNTLKTTRSSLMELLSPMCGEIRKTGHAPAGLQIKSPSSQISEMPGFQDGAFQVQDEAAQLVGEMLAPLPGQRVLDACAGLGGKTGHIAQLMDNTGVLTALDTEQNKLAALQQEMQRLGISITDTRCLDVKKSSIKDFDDYFDRVLVDAPCSGLGVIRRNPDTKWKRKPQEIPRYAGRQKKILNAAASLVRPGGLLVYAVCSCEEEENEAVVTSFLAKRKDFALDTGPMPDSIQPLLSPDGYLKTYPDILDMDGFFAARLRRRP